MGQSTDPARRYSVHARHEGRQHSHGVEARSFEEAAVAFVERWSSAADSDGDVSVLVSEEDSGVEHCFSVNLDEGEAAPCG